MRKADADKYPSLEAIRYSHENEVLGTPPLDNLFTKTSLAS